MKGLKKHLSMPALLAKVQLCFKTIPSSVGMRSKLPLSDCLMSALAIFSLKMPSLLQFEEYLGHENVEHNIKQLYQIGKIPCDTYLRERLDVVEYGHLRKAFKQLFALVQRQKTLERFKYYEEHYLISLDGTGCFSSHEIHCDACCVKHHQDGTVTYYHNMLGAVLVHPDEKTVIPLAPEPILKQDGTKKNDCELNASKRLLNDLRREHPHLKTIIVEDALYANAPHIQLLRSLNMRYIIGVKEGDHGYLFKTVRSSKIREKIVQEGGFKRCYRWVNDVPLSESQSDCRVNFLEYEEVSLKGRRQRFSWVTDIELAPSTVFTVMRGGRARWKIENETFNTLKNQGYHFEHNFGHGYQYLSTVMAMLMFLAFLIDQIQETCCQRFQRALKKMQKKRCLWSRIRVLFEEYFIDSWDLFYDAIEFGHQKSALTLNTS